MWEVTTGDDYPLSRLYRVLVVCPALIVLGVPARNQICAVKNVSCRDAKLESHRVMRVATIIAKGIERVHFKLDGGLPRATVYRWIDAAFR